LRVGHSKTPHQAGRPPPRVAPPPPRHTIPGSRRRPIAAIPRARPRRRTCAGALGAPVSMCGRRARHPRRLLDRAPYKPAGSPYTYTHVPTTCCAVGPAGPKIMRRARIREPGPGAHTYKRRRQYTASGFRSGLANACTRPMGASLELWTDLYARTARVVVVVLVLYRGALV